MPEISLADLLAWEPRLRYASDGGVDDAALDREVTWAVTIRATPPLLPQVRGGEIVLLPSRLLAEAATESGVTLPALLHELAGHRITAAVLEELPSAAPLPVLVARQVTPELESELNRLLTQRRGELYRVGTELGRVLANLTAAQATLPQIVAAASDVAGYPVSVRDAHGTVIATAGPPARQPPTPTGASLTRQLAGNGVLQLDHVPAAGHALARLLADRIALAIESALLRSERERPRGPAREAALHLFLTGQVPQPDLVTLGLPAGTPLRVVLAGPGWDETPLGRELGHSGPLHAAGRIDGLRAVVLEARAGAGPRHGRVRAQAPATPTEAAAVGQWLACSAPVTTTDDVTAATRQARYIAALLAARALPGPIVHFDAVDEIGLYQLLYPLWGTPALASFVAATLGELPAHDRRGIFRQTLLTYLEAGGSHVEAATRLGIHRNTLTYRLKQIAELTGHDPDEPVYRLAIHTALLAEKLPPVLPVQGDSLDPAP